MIQEKAKSVKAASGSLEFLRPRMLSVPAEMSSLYLDNVVRPGARYQLWRRLVDNRFQ